MSELPKIEVEMINLKRRLAVSNMGYGTIESFYDANGDETHDASIAVTAVIGWFVGGWSAVVLADFSESVS